MSEIPTIVADKLAAFTPGELEQLRGIVQSPLYLKMLSVAACMKPSANCQGAGSAARDEFSNDRANARLGEMRGWELHQMALFLVLNPKAARTPVEEDFQPAEVTPVQPVTQKK